MADYTETVKKLLRKHGCIFVRHGRGDHDRWYSPITNRYFTVDGKINKRYTANETLKEAGVFHKL